MILFLQLLLTFSSIPTHALASQLLCSCAPLVYRWTLDFSQVCDFNSIGNSNGIIGADVGEDEAIEFATCSIYTEYPDEELSMIPVSVIRYQIIELGLNMQRLKEFSSTALEDFVPLVHGQEITFDSTLQTVGGEIPKGLIVFAFAVNDKGDQIELQWMIRYSNFCEMYPLHNGDSLGWMVFVSKIFKYLFKCRNCCGLVGILYYKGSLLILRNHNLIFSSHYFIFKIISSCCRC